jgi:AAA+ ATPase superfamily predicted ATPase
MDWGFYGRADELRAVTQIIRRNRWYFAKMTGRRRIGKTTLIQKAIQAAGETCAERWRSAACSSRT